MNIKHISLLMLLCVAGCKQGTEFTAVGDSQPALQDNDPALQSKPDLVPVLRKAQPQKTAPQTTEAQKNQSQPKVQSQQKNSVTYAKGEKIYVETYGAQGRVWGYVTMNGDRGTGTIHDWDENTWAVNVTRHGDELFAIDQNSRQYVFKLKQNKQQQ